MSVGLSYRRGVRVGPVRFAIGAPRLRVAIAVLVTAVALLLGGWLWLRDSSLVAVTDVTVTGTSGPDAAAIRTALAGAARGMTTLDVNVGQLRTVVAPFAVVKGLRVTTQFPHGMRIRVIEQLPVATVLVAGRRIAVAGDGSLLRDTIASTSLPLLPLAVPPGGPRLTGPGLQAVSLLAAAPYQLLQRISQVSTVAGRGLVVQLRGGPSIYFGDSGQLRTKWIAATAVLGDPGSAGASYIDVTDPVRPAAGADGQTASSTNATASSTNATASPTGAGASSGASASPANTTFGGG